MKNNQGVSLIILIITIAVIIIIASMTLQTSSDVPDKAHYTEYMQEMKNVQTGIDNAKVTNSQKGTTIEKLTKGFKKVYLDNVPASFVSFGDINEEITGYMVNLRSIGYEGSKYGHKYGAYFDLEEEEIPIIQFGEKIGESVKIINEKTLTETTRNIGEEANDVYVFDATWQVYYLKGLKYEGDMNYTFQ